MHNFCVELCIAFRYIAMSDAALKRTGVCCVGVKLIMNKVQCISEHYVGRYALCCSGATEKSDRDTEKFYWQKIVRKFLTKKKHSISPNFKVTKILGRVRFFFF